MVTTTEIAPEIYRLALFVPEINLEFSHFLVRDDEPLLFHAGLQLTGLRRYNLNHRLLRRIELSRENAAPQMHPKPKGIMPS